LSGGGVGSAEKKSRLPRRVVTELRGEGRSFAKKGLRRESVKEPAIRAIPVRLYALQLYGSRRVLSQFSFSGFGPSSQELGSLRGRRGGGRPWLRALRDYGKFRRLSPPIEGNTRIRVVVLEEREETGPPKMNGPD